MITIEQQMMRSGLGTRTESLAWIERGEVWHNRAPATAGAALSAGDEISVRDEHYRVERVARTPRLLLKSLDPEPAGNIGGAIRVHCGFHKCLTMYMHRILAAAGGSDGFRHFFHRQDLFYRECGRYRLCSISGHAVDLSRFDDLRISRFIRDPRDMLISGYFYHKRGAEHWCNYRNPVDEDWAVIDAPVPAALPANTSLSEYLNRVSVEEGLLAEIEFRRHHFDSFRRWPSSDERVRCYRYEDILGNEVDVVADLLRFHGLRWWPRRRGIRIAETTRASAKSRRKGHIRNPGSGQWRDHFTPAVQTAFEDAYGDILDQLGYRWD